MKCLLDTVVFLWVIFDEREKLSRKVLSILNDGSVELYLSAVSVWEIAIKYSLGRLSLKKDPTHWLPEVILKMGLNPLSMSQRHALAVGKLPFHHKDPFDRLLICQARLEEWPVITPDAIFKKYRVPVIW